MGTPDGSSGGGQDIRLNAQHVRDIATFIGNESTVFSENALSESNAADAAFGGSAAASELSMHYIGAQADLVVKNAECEAMLADYRSGLVGAVQDLGDSDNLNAVALNHISDIDPGRA